MVPQVYVGGTLTWQGGNSKVSGKYDYLPTAFRDMLLAMIVEPVPTPRLNPIRVRIRTALEQRAAEHG